MLESFSPFDATVLPGVWEARPWLTLNFELATKNGIGVAKTTECSLAAKIGNCFEFS